MSKKEHILRLKETAKNQPLPSLNGWVTQKRDRGSVIVNEIYCREYRLPENKNFIESHGKITDNEVKSSILFLINTNLNGIFWSLFLKNKTLDLSCYRNPYFSHFYDCGEQVSKWNGELKITKDFDFNQILEMLGITYKITKEGLNSTDLPTIDFIIDFDLDKVISIIKKHTIKLIK